MRCSFRVRPNKRFFNAKGREGPFLGPYAQAPPTLTSAAIAPFPTEMEPPGATGGAWGESGGAPYSIRVKTRPRAEPWRGGEGGGVGEEDACKGRTLDNVSDALWKGSLSSSPRRADRRQGGGASWARAPRSHSPVKGGSDKENLDEGRDRATVRQDTAVTLGENPKSWAIARHNRTASQKYSR